MYWGVTKNVSFFPEPVKVKAGRVGPPPLKDGVYYVNPFQDDQMVMTANHFFYYGGTKCIIQDMLRCMGVEWQAGKYVHNSCNKLKQQQFT